MKAEIRAELDRLFEKHKELTPQLIVDEATNNEQSPLRLALEWDYELAGEQWRLHQAKEVIREWKVTILIERAGEVEPIRVRVRKWNAVVTEDKRHIYVSFDAATSNATYRGQILEGMQRDWKALRRKYEIYDEFWTLIQEASHEQPTKATTRKRTRADQVDHGRKSHAGGGGKPSARVR